MRNFAPSPQRAMRRDFLRIGSLFSLGLGCQLRLPKPINAQESVGNRIGNARSCILLWLDGGPSHLETFDPKHDVPEEVRGPFRPISTVVPGVELSELLPLTARITDKLAIIRSMTSPLGEHGIANQYMLTGYQPGSPVSYPCLGSVVAQRRSADLALPSYVAFPETRSSMGPGFLGPSCGPFSIVGDPANADFQVPNLDYYPGLDDQRLHRRREFLQKIESLDRSLAADSVQLDPTFEQAFRLISTPAAKRAFQLTEESEETRRRYGNRTFGQGCLLARRLIERGVGFVSVLHAGWDTHQNLKLSLRDGFSGAKVGVGLVPTFDQAFSALIEDLQQRRLLDETLVVAMGEFGRTPKVNTRGGRDHWPRVFSVVLAGGGVRGGQTIGASDRVGESPEERPITPADLANTIYRLLGIDPDHELVTPDGRPIRINQGGSFVSEVV